MSAENQATPRPTPASDRMIRYAETLVREGRRPTVDALVAAMGGSRTTAQNALNHFWRERLPRLIDMAAASRTDLPPRIQDAAGAFWLFAQTTAAESAAVTLQREREVLQAMREEALARVAEAEDRAARATATSQQAADVLQARNAHIQSLTEQIAPLRAAMDNATTELAAAHQHIAQLTQRIVVAEALAESERQSKAQAAQAAVENSNRLQAMCAERLQSVEADHQKRIHEMIAAERALRAEQERTHAQTVAALRDTYHDAEQRCMVALDAAKTQVSKLQKEVRIWQQRCHSAESRVRDLEIKMAAKKHAARHADAIRSHTAIEQ